MKTPWISVIGMLSAVSLSNYLVEIPVNDWFTWGAFSYPLTFLITELTQFYTDAQTARKTVYWGFGLSVVFGLIFLAPRIALASCSAFLIGQLLDIYLFGKLRRNQNWW